jgi:hypothetical protein
VNVYGNPLCRQCRRAGGDLVDIMNDKSLGEALAAADAANMEDLLGLYPMAARVLAGEYRAMKDVIEGMKIDMELLNTKNMALASDLAKALKE